MFAFPSLLKELLNSPGSFAFPQAVDIFERWLCYEGHVVSTKSFRYSVSPSLSFPPRDIAAVDIVVREDMKPQVQMMLNLMGLHGAGSPLPAYFTEYVAQHADEQNTLKDFFDIFNHLLVTLLHGTWKKYRYYAQYRVCATDRLSKRFSGFIGVGHPALREAKKLRWPRLMAYMGLIAFKSESAGSMESILRHYFAHPAISIIPCITRWVSVPEDQQTRLGDQNDMLGIDFVIGDEVPDQTGKFRVRIAELTLEKFNAFLPSGDKFDELQTLVKFILKSRLDFDVELCLLPDEIRPWCLDRENECRLGWSTWSGDGGEGVVVLETDHREL
ncbi:type VI secretion system baseplate subunit TssG [Desulfosarcina sp. OttesenSCG-928-G10]|nr:type VI secretion system baseplate subunit TssG [Desulfosarcina sp. OttesenSCG-928-G10]